MEEITQKREIFERSIRIMFFYMLVKIDPQIGYGKLRDNLTDVAIMDIYECYAHITKVSDRDELIFNDISEYNKNKEH